MVTRYLQSTGGSSFFITLPKDWIIRNKIKTKDELNVYQTNNNSLVITKNSVQEKTVQINTDDIKLRHLAREIIGFYLAGCSNIVFKTSNYFSVGVRKTIKEQVDLLMGFELFEEEANEMVLTRVAKNEVPIEKYVIKMLKVILSMINDLKTVFKNKDMDLAQDIILRDDVIDKINLFVNKKFISDLQSFGVDNNYSVSLIDIYFYQEQSVRLERIADHMVKIAFSIEENPDWIINETEIKLLDKASILLGMVEELFITKNKKIAHKLLDEYDKLKQRRKNGSSIHTIENSLWRILGYSGNIAEGVIDILSNPNIE